MEKRTEESDMISQLPEHITDQILSRMPIRDEVRTGTLSRQWRFKWTSIPRLVFDDQCTRTNAPGQPSQKLVKIVDRVLLRHTGPQTFMLSHSGFFANADIDHWILHLSTSSIKGITLYIYNGWKYKIPTCLLNCRDLVYLQLFKCSVRIPSSFEGFKKLNTLHLHSIELSANELEAMISRCPLLKDLILKNLEGITQVKVEAYNLELLNIGGAFLDVNFRAILDFTFGVTNRLKSVTVGFDDNIENRQGNLHKFFRDIHNVHILKIENYSLKYLALENVPKTLPHAFIHLKYLSTCIDFNSKEQILALICLIRSCPHLKKVDFKSHPKNRQTTGIVTMADFWKDHHWRCLEQVQVVSIVNISGTEQEQEFMKFLLSSLPNLQTMMIRLGVKIVEGKLLGDLLLGVKIVWSLNKLFREMRILFGHLLLVSRKKFLIPYMF